MKLGCWALENDPDGTSQRARDAYDRRDAYFAETFGGTWVGRQMLDPVSGQIISAEHARLEKALFDSDWAEARERLGREPTISDLRRSPAQRRADAFVEMARRSARPAAGKAPKPLFTVTIGERAFAWMCRLASGEVVSPAGLIPWITDAQLEAILFDGGGRAIEVSRRRDFTGALRRVIEVRDGFCACGCGTPAERCQIDDAEAGRDARCRRNTPTRLVWVAPSLRGKGMGGGLAAARAGGRMRRDTYGRAG